MATDVRQLTIDVLEQHSKRTDPNHPGWPNCRCGFDTEVGEWTEHVADYLLASLRNAGVGFAYPGRRNMTPGQVADLIGRLERADVELTAMGNAAPTTPYAGGLRFKGKAEGVRLALSYIREYTSGSA